jgi:outer membrane lipopolysaccharide assembly protein LptE/RlpB
MKKLLFCLCLFGLLNCSGYEPIFATKNLTFGIEEIININNDDITKKISKNLRKNISSKNNKKNYTLEISANKKNEITSKDTNGNALTFEMSVNAEVKIYYNNDDNPIETLKVNNNFSYNNQESKFDLSEYKKTIEENIIKKISQNIIVKLQLL